MKNFLSITTIVLLFVSCGEIPKTEQKNETNNEIKTEQKCKYVYLNDATSVHWTAYKHTAKNPVNGKFEDFKSQTETSEAESVADILKTMKMTILVSSINSKDSSRDRKLVDFFFNKMADTDKIAGVVRSVTDNSGLMTMRMNNVEQDVNFTYSVDENNKLELRATIDVLNFQGGEALASLNKACEEKHTGADGESKLWSEVDIYITTQLNKTCD